MRFYHTLAFRVLVGSSLLLLALFGLYSYLAVRFHTSQMMAQVFESANRVSDVIRNSTRYSMLLNRREDVFQIITTIGKEQGVDGIRIYNKRGEIMFSTNKTEEQTIVNMHAEACYACHDSARPLQSLPINNRTRIYKTADGYRILGLINPIRNEAVCSNAECHAHPADRTVLGVLDVRMSLDRVDANITSARRRLVLYALLMSAAVALASGLFLLMTVHRPVQRLIEGTRQISSGHLDYKIRTTSGGEIGELARLFNEMTESLQEAEKQNRQWSETLEKRVHEKTEELKRIHEQIIQIEKMASLGKLAATVAHELNNPLEGILTYAKLIAKRLRKSGDRSDVSLQTMEDVELVTREVERCGNIVKNLLLFSKKQVGEFGVVPIRQIIEKVTRLMQHHLKISNVALQMELEASDATLMCDENQVEQALVALIVNAVEAMPGGGRLTLAANSDPGGEVRISLADTGAGIAPDDLPHVFEPFFTTKKEGKRVGLGLSIVYGIVERHGGAVAVQSEVGKGTVFTLTFPPAAGSQPRIEAKGKSSTQAVV